MRVQARIALQRGGLQPSRSSSSASVTTCAESRRTGWSVRQHVRQLVAEHAGARRFRARKAIRGATSMSSRSASTIWCKNVLARCEHAVVVQRPPAAQALPRDHDVEAGVLEHLERVTRGLAVEVVVERVGAEHHALRAGVGPPDAAMARVPRRERLLGEQRDAPLRRHPRRSLRERGDADTCATAFTTRGAGRCEVRPVRDQAEGVGPDRARGGLRSSARGLPPCTSPCRR